MYFDVTQTPFSRYGSYFAYSHLPTSGSRSGKGFLRTIHGEIPSRELFEIELLSDNTPVSFTEIATPTLLLLEAEVGYVEMCLPEPKVIRLRGVGVGIRLRQAYIGPNDAAFAVEDQRWQINSHSHRTQYMLTSLRGRFVVDAPWNVDRCDYIVADFLPDSSTGSFEGVIEEFRYSWRQRNYPESFKSCLSTVEEEYLAWLATMPTIPASFARSGEHAAYVNWSCVVAPERNLTRPTMYMSKYLLTNVWSWDNCFNAMAQVYHNPELAWDQFLLLIDHQDETGAFPDFFNDNYISWNFCKPPIHGWTLKWMMQRTNFMNRERLVEVYEPLSRWTNWWFDYRDDDHNGIPQYNYGEDSGWDNCTVFRGGVPMESPDLAAYLVIQMDVLSELAGLLDRTEDAQEWKVRADELLEKMLAHLWHGDRFVALRSGSHVVCESESLLLFLPIILGKRLPKDVQSKLIEGLRKEGRFITPYGLASESLGSEYYQTDGYWRGPIWAPSTMIIVDGLTSIGEIYLAREISRRFCTMVAKSGMAENFNSLTGEGLCDPAHSWTASVFLILAHEYLQE